MHVIYISVLRVLVLPPLLKTVGFLLLVAFSSSPDLRAALLLLNKQGPDYDPTELELNIPWKAS